MTALLGAECAEQVKKMVNSGGADVSFVMAPVRIKFTCASRLYE